MSELKNSKTISVIGLGKLGSCFVAFVTKSGYKVIGVDLDETVVDAVRLGRAPKNVVEPGLAETLFSNRHNIETTLDFEHAIMKSSITFIIVPTPSNADASFSTLHVVAAARNIGKVLKCKKDYHLVVLVSTVLPEDCRKGVIKFLENCSGKKCGLDFGFCYNPEFIALGSVLQQMSNPDLVLIGEYDDNSGKILKDFYSGIKKQGIMPVSTPVRVMTLENAELAKLALNSYVTMKITFANILADVCCKLPNGDVDKVTQAMGSDTRIGNKYLTGGTGYGGPCFPRDVRAFSYILRRYESFSSLPDTINLINKDLSSNLINVLLKTRTLTFGQTIGVLGLAYKPGTPVVEESQSIKFIKEYFEHPAFSQDKIIGYDPLANENAKIELKNYTFFKTVDSVEECITKSDILIVMTPEECFKYTSVDFSESNSPYQVIDLWRLFEDRFVGEDKYVVMYVPWGKEWTQWWLM